MKERSAIDLTCLDGSMIIESHEAETIRLPKNEIATLLRFALDMWPDLLVGQKSAVGDYRDEIRRRVDAAWRVRKACRHLGGICTPGCATCEMTRHAIADLDTLLRTIDRMATEADIRYRLLKDRAANVVEALHELSERFGLFPGDTARRALAAYLELDQA